MKSILIALLLPLLLLRSTTPATAQPRLPLSTIFQGQERFNALVQLSERENWRALPLGERTARVALSLVGTPYKGYTLEIDDHIESPSVNFYGLDCWTFYEISLAFARMIQAKAPPYTPVDLLRCVEIERYRNGRCDGTYLSRIHFLEEVFYDNARRGILVNPTRQLGGIPVRKQIREMTNAWRSYRYLRNNPQLRPGMARVEDRVSALPVFYIPKSRVPLAEPGIRTGDILAITCSDSGSYTSHVGLALRDRSGVLRFMHATSSRDKGYRVIVDTRISSYLNESSSHSGLVVARPLDLPPGSL